MANKELLSAFYHPTTLVMIDDNLSFLRTLKLLFTTSKVDIFEEPLEALAFLNQYVRPTSSAKKALQTTDPELYAIENYQFNVNLINFLSIVNNANRFHEIAVIIVDYHMSGIDGLELCRKLKDHRYKIILITADEDRGIAVDELSKGTIDYYLMKSEPEFNKKLSTIVDQMKKAYFHELSRSVIEPLIDDKKSIFSQISFPTFLNTFIAENNIVEYYLIEPNGSLMMLDINGCVHWLLIKNEEDLNSFQDLAIDSQAPAIVLSAIKSKIMLPFFVTKNEMAHVEGKLWDDYIYPSKPIPGAENFYYAHVKDKMLFPLEGEIQSYHDFLKSNL